MEKSMLILAILLTCYIVLAVGDQSCQLQLLAKEAEANQFKEDMAKLRQEMEGEVDTLRQKMDEIAKAQLDRWKRPLIAFSANTPYKTHFAVDDIIIFKHTTHNEGYGYYENKGVFRAPVCGLYQFTVHVCNKENQHVAYAIVHNGVEIALSVQVNNPYQSCSSSSALIRMAKNGKVWIKCTYPTVFGENRYRRAAFTGVLLR